jgi:hypothetical protein
MTCFRLLGVIALLLSLSAVPSPAQHIPLPPDAGLQPPPGARNDQAPPDPDVQHKMEKLRQKQRFEDMKRDSQKLLDLATELKQYVDKSGENVLSVEVVRKAEEMEKLAHQVKNNMRGD